MKVCLLALMLLWIPKSWAQVNNDNIQGRLDLLLNAPLIQSTTAGSTVEWKCINRNLTRKCLIYHNDQWFSFQVPQAGTYYLNIASQQCRDSRGIQMILIEGNPCQIDSYKILKCISKVRMEDVFIQMDSLKSQVQYLVNIDGFLGDYCHFEIGLSTKPSGWPLKLSDSVARKREVVNSKVVALHWQVPESELSSLERFQLYRKGSNELSATSVGKVDLKLNSYGRYGETYDQYDTLPKEGKYLYSIFAIEKEEGTPRLIEEVMVSYSGEASSVKSPKETAVTLSLDFPEGKLFQVIVIDRDSNAVLFRRNHLFSKARYQAYKIDMAEWMDAGARTFSVIVSDFSAAGEVVYYYSLDESGNLVGE